jgi:enoyl-[acyl-carrier-protein] reductase (NADH)
MGVRLAKAAYGVKENIHELDSTSGFGRVCAPVDIANVVRFLVSPLNTYLSGERIYVHGGVM